MMKKIAVIGAGLTGATAAATLVEQGFQVTVFDKGRSAGGRMSSKRTESGYLDMGAQYFTARTDKFKQQLQQWLDAGHAQPWSCKTALLCNEDGVVSFRTSSDEQERFIAVPSMQSLAKVLLHDVLLINGCRIDKLEHTEAGWNLYSEAGLSYTDFDGLLLTLPPAQAQQLMIKSHLSDLFHSITDLLQPCWAVAMQAEASALGDAIFCLHPKLRFISHQQHKAGRNPCYILHFNAAFSALHLQETAQFWFAQATEILRQELKLQHEIVPIAAHRWLYASQQDQAIAPGLIRLPGQHLWAGGDWSYGGRVENAYLAGLELADAVVKARQLVQERA